MKNLFLIVGIALSLPVIATDRSPEAQAVLGETCQYYKDQVTGRYNRSYNLQNFNMKKHEIIDVIYKAIELRKEYQEKVELIKDEPTQVLDQLTNLYKNKINNITTGTMNISRLELTSKHWRKPPGITSRALSMEITLPLELSSADRKENSAHSPEAKVIFNLDMEKGLGPYTEIISLYDGRYRVIHAQSQEELNEKVTETVFSPFDRDKGMKELCQDESVSPENEVAIFNLRTSTPPQATPQVSQSKKVGSIN